MAARTLVSWSSGKDSAFALHVLCESPDIEVIGLFATVNSVHKRVNMHAVRDELLLLQADAIGLPLTRIEIPHPCSTEQYAAVMRRFVDEAKTQGVTAMAFGDLFLEDVRRYREEKLSHTGITPVFPLWGKRTDLLAREVIDQGFRMVTTCVDPRVLSRRFVGRDFDDAFLKELPSEVDPCGENGEFHTFVYDGPIFTRPLEVRVGRIVEEGGFIFADVFSEDLDTQKTGESTRATP